MVAHCEARMHAEGLGQLNDVYPNKRTEGGEVSTKSLTRREFLRYAGVTSVGLAVAACAPSVAPALPTTGPATAAAAAATAITGPKSGGVLKIGILADVATMGDPAKMTVVSSTTQAAPAIETLFRTDKSGKPVPWLATDAINDLANKAITIPLRKGVKFHDGTDFNADAVKWNLEQCMTGKTGGTENFKSIDKVDDSTVRINLTQWDNTVTVNLGQIIGAMISPAAYKANGAEWAGSHPVGTGPFKFVSWEKTSEIVYEKFDGYWQKGKPYLDGIEIHVIADPVTRLISFRKGEVDFLTFITAKDAADLEKEGFGVNRARAGSGALGWVHDSIKPDSPFAKLEVRQAVQHAIDVDAIAKTIFYGSAEPANQWIYKGHWAYNSSITGYPYNPDKAKQLLAQAGFANGFNTKLAYITNNADYAPLSTSVQAFLKNVGIDAQLDPAPITRWSQVALSGGTWDGMWWAGISPNPDVAAALASRYMGGGRYYSQMLVPDDYVKAIQTALAAGDFESKAKATQDAMKLMIDKYCLRTVVCCTSDMGVYDKKVHNTGWFETPVSAWWTPEDAWIG